MAIDEMYRDTAKLWKSSTAGWGISSRLLGPKTSSLSRPTTETIQPFAGRTIRENRFRSLFFIDELPAFLGRAQLSPMLPQVWANFSSFHLRGQPGPPSCRIA